MILPTAPKEESHCEDGEGDGPGQVDAYQHSKRHAGGAPPLHSYKLLLTPALATLSHIPALVSLST